jgi:hypothetical protein
MGAERWLDDWDGDEEATFLSRMRYATRRLYG